MQIYGATLLLPALIGQLDHRKEKGEALVVATKEFGLEVNADKTKYMIMSRDQNA